MEKGFDMEEKYENILRLGGSYPEETYLARVTGSSKLVVRKIVSRECGLLYAQLLHINDPHLPHIYEIYPQNEGTEVILDYISGDSLDGLVNRFGGLGKEQAIDYFQQLLQILQDIHREGIVHRDINPNNIIISTDGVLKLLDFGIARKPKENRTQDTTILGTVGYAAPEQFGFRQTDQRTDIYAAGVLLNFMLTGQMPTDQRAQQEYDKLIEKCIQIDPNLRYQNIQQLQADFDKISGKQKRNAVQIAGQNVGTTGNRAKAEIGRAHV